MSLYSRLRLWILRFGAFLVIASGLCLGLRAEPDSGRAVRLTTKGDNYKPAWSPNGDRIAFESNRDGNLELYVMRANGSRVKRLTNDPSSDAGPSWTPDGQHLLFYSDRTTEQNPDGRWRLYRLTLETLEVLPIEVALGDTFRPVSSPDGTRIVFDAWHPLAGTHQLFMTRSDGSQLTRLTDSESYESAPRWSPDGSKLVFFSERDAPRADNPRDTPAEIYRMNVDGSAATRLSFLEARSHYPTWSPDGNRIAFETDDSGNLELFVMGADGSNPINITNHPSRDTSVSWSPRGDDLLFVSDREGDSNIYRMPWRGVETER